MKLKYGYIGEGHKGFCEVDDVLIASFIPADHEFARARIDLSRREPDNAILYLSAYKKVGGNRKQLKSVMPLLTKEAQAKVMSDLMMVKNIKRSDVVIEDE